MDTLMAVLFSRVGCSAGAGSDRRGLWECSLAGLLSLRSSGSPQKSGLGRSLGRQIPGFCPFDGGLTSVRSVVDLRLASGQSSIVSGR